MNRGDFVKSLFSVLTLVSALTTLCVIGLGLWQRDLSLVGFGAWVLVSTICAVIAVEA